MFFKRLEITGFKSFAKKTVLDFLPGITVIVGPNGCGKSNIFDAVRWALGEQRSRTLRGQRMSDIIFSGSATVKPQSMASVNLIVNNEDRRLPLDFSEVQVGRRLYRVGDDEYESKYLLNGTSCRLREITNLFMDTGVGTNSYSVMEQGHVDFIINARPNERRFLFDEAVGISKYRSRRDEALRKLERTEADLQRINDLLSERKTRLRSLKIQANRAERYKKLVAQVRELERNLMLIGYRALLAEKQGVDEQYEAVNSDLQAVVARMAQGEQSLIEKQAQIDELDRESEAKRTRRRQMAAELERAQSRQTLLRERITSTESQMRRDESQLESLRKDREQLVGRSERILADRQALEKELVRLETEQKARRRQFDDLVQSQSDARQKLAGLREKTRSAIEETNRREQERRIASLMKQQSAENLLRERVQLGESRARVCSALHRLRRCKAERAVLAESLAESKARIDELENRRNEQAENLRAMEERRTEASRARHEAETRRRALRSLQENYEGFVRGVREIMGAAERGELSGIVGIVANLIESPPQEELAIETALANRVQDIVVEHENAAQNGMAFLRRRQLGRATFLPLDGLSPATREPSLAEMAGRPGVVGIAADLVHSDPRFRPVVEALLGEVVVVENLETARRLHEQGSRARFVTRGGTVLSAEGALTGGHVRPSRLLAREREIREFARRIEQLDQTLADLDVQITEQIGAVEAASAEREALRERLRSIENAIAQLDAEIGRAADDLDETQRARRQAEREVGRLAAKIRDYGRSLAEHGRMLDESNARAAELKKQLERVEATTEDRDQQASVLQEALGEIMAEVSASRERLEAARQRGTELDEQIARCDDEIGHYTAELESLGRFLDEACAEIEETGRHRDQLAAQLEDLEREIEQGAQRRRTMSEELQQVQHQLHAQQRRRNELQNELHEVDRRRAQCEVQLQNLDEQAHEKFRAGLEELSRQAGEIDTPREQLVSEIGSLRSRIESMGEVNVIAIEEHRKLSEQYEFLDKQRSDLEEAKAGLRKTIRTIDATSAELFAKGMATIRERFRETFRRLFGGGRADLLLVDPDDILNSGVDIVAQPPGKRQQNITLLSGGEKALTAISLLFGIFLFRPSPFCVLDEIDAPLDDTNIERFKSMVIEFSKDIQFIIITHNKQTMALADTLYGVTMEEPGISRIVSVRFDQVEESVLVG